MEKSNKDKSVGKKRSTSKFSKGVSKTNKNINNKSDNSIKNNTNKETNIMTFVSSYKFLYSILIILFIIVLVLGIVTYNKVSEHKKTTGDMFFPLIEEGFHTSFSLDLFELSKEDDYTIKISNYRNDNINKNDVSYTINVNNTSDSNVIITKDDDKTNLINDNKNSIIEGEMFKKNEKEYAIYHISVDRSSTIKKGDKIYIEINS